MHRLRALSLVCAVCVGWGQNGGNAGGPGDASVAPEIDQVHLSVTLTGAGHGSVFSSPPGIACGGTCSAAVARGTAITLTAIAADGDDFLGWDRVDCAGTGPCTVSLTGD